MEKTSFSGGEQHNNRQKQLLKKLTENEFQTADPSQPKSNNKKKRSLNYVGRIDKSHTRSYCVDQSTTKVEEETISSTNSEDVELRRYVREFKKKVEKKYTDSTCNKIYKFPFVDT